jgi:N-acetylglutamate synthase-like GNAT family acetyltransferase
MKNELSIRPAKNEDINDIFAVLESANMHYIPSEEVPELNINETFVAEYNGKIVGIAGIKALDDDYAKTTVMAVYPEYRGLKIGNELQNYRMCYAYNKLNKKFIRTLSDRPHVIKWYQKYFNYKDMGIRVEKVHEFGDPDVNEWTVLESDLQQYFSVDIVNN